MTRAVPLSALPADVRAKLSKQTPRGKGKKTLMTENAKAFEQAKKQAAIEIFFAMLKRASLPVPAREVRFHDLRQWKFDYAWVDRHVALEVEGGAYVEGRHTRGQGFERDLVKYNTAATMGWKVLRVLPKQLASKATEEMLRRCLK